jgi:peptide-methionine (R)-S-oxide reductase
VKPKVARRRIQSGLYLQDHPMPHLNRRSALLLSAGALAAPLAGFLAAPARAANGKYPFRAPNAGKAFAESPFRKLSANDWKKRLSAAAFYVLRREGTETPGTSPLTDDPRAGAFVCAGCELPLFKSEWKYHSGTGWPSFYQALPGAVETKTDSTLGMVRDEYHCARCLGHQGHIFTDGPAPTGLRYCNNGVALKFIPTA